MRLAFDIVVLVNDLAGPIFQTKADDDAVNSRLALCFIGPVKCAMGKMDVNALRQQPAPEYADLFTLRDAVGRNKCATRLPGRALTLTLSQRERE